MKQKLTSKKYAIKPVVKVNTFTQTENKKNRIYIYVLLTIGLILYSNSLFNNYAFDDYTYIVQNNYVQQGFKGIGKILQTDALEGYIKANGGSVNDLSGGRYRPLSLITFAIEQSVFGGNPLISHFINIGLYLLTIFFLFHFLNKRVFKDKLGIAFLATLIFAIHPLHTEVVANIKSRDEILSFLFIILSLEYFFRYQLNKNSRERLLTLLFFFLALLSKEYAMFLVVFIPLLSYVMLKKSIRDCFIASIPFVAVAILYIVIRLSVIGFHTGNSSIITNNPYVLADAQQKIATKMFVLFYYIRLLFVPYPLSCDYSYNTFPYRTFVDPMVILSILVYLILIVFTIFWIRKRNILSIALLFYLLPLFFVSNFFIDIGATMGERLVYHSSLGFAILLAFGFSKFLNSRVAKNKEQAVVLILALVLTLSSAFVIIPRNNNWKNNLELFTHDVNVVPSSLLMNNNAGNELTNIISDTLNINEKDSLFKKSVFYFNRGIKVYPKWIFLPINLGNVYYKMGMKDSAEQIWKRVKKDFPGQIVLNRYLNIIGSDYFNKAMAVGKKGDVDSAIVYLKKGIDIDSSNSNYWFNLGGAYSIKKDFENALKAWEMALILDPKNENAKKALEALRVK